MTNSPIIRDSASDEQDKILALYPMMFPEEDLRPLVSELLGAQTNIVSLVACQATEPMAHLLFTLFADDEGALLGPLGVRPDYQGQGVGSEIVGEGLARLTEAGVRQVFVLGDPKYYGRFGFVPERKTLPPYALPAEWVDAWQSVCLAGRDPIGEGVCALPEAWMKPELWAP